MIDLDDFKLYNDIYGHDMGDQVLCIVADVIKNCIRKTDKLIRYGGDEFLLILPSIKKHIFEDKLKLIREKIHDAVVPNYEKMQLSVSIGGAIFREGNMEDAVASADRQMYIAKNYKNMVVTEWDENGKKKEENSAPSPACSADGSLFFPSGKKPSAASEGNLAHAVQGGGESDYRRGGGKCTCAYGIRCKRAFAEGGGWRKLHRQHHMRKPILRPAEPRYHKAAK